MTAKVAATSHDQEETWTQNHQEYAGEAEGKVAVLLRQICH